MKILTFIGTSIIWVILSIALVFLILGAILFYIFLGIIFSGLFVLIGIIFIIGWIFFSKKKKIIKKK